jgi:hypothetical protein
MSWFGMAAIACERAPRRELSSGNATSQGRLSIDAPAGAVKPPIAVAALLRRAPPARSTRCSPRSVIALVGFGVVMVYSASAIEATVRYHDAQFFLKRRRSTRCIAHRRDVAVEPHRLPPPAPAHVPDPLHRGAACCCVRHRLRPPRGQRLPLAQPRARERAARGVAKLGVVIWLAYSLSKKAEKHQELLRGLPPAPARGRRARGCSASSSPTSAAPSCSCS